MSIPCISSNSRYSSIVPYGSADFSSSASISSSVTSLPYNWSKIDSKIIFCKTVSPIVSPFCNGSFFICSYKSCSRIRPASVEATSVPLSEQPASSKAVVAKAVTNNFFINTYTSYIYSSFEFFFNTRII